ncbi:pregnancy zone protein-like isoform X4 [Chrysoperla carnea]|uniref:pregnancy zone protein-like isoform X4 n=1 Tax=Chrysoperla carnea TaxID=189513 RepID=UPI001D0764F0|nr:pregnancy zone protein-like isoform X4 [Chrysoperla carnea]
MLLKLIFVFTFVIQLYLTNAEELITPDYLFLTPKQLTVNSNEKVCVAVYNTSSTPAKFDLELVESKSKKVLTSLKDQDLTEDDNIKCISIQIPETLDSDGLIKLKISFPTSTQYETIKNSKEVRINTSPKVVLVETDKGVYKPGQVVKFRVLTIDQDLKPVRDNISKIWLENPSGIRIAQWLNVSSNNGFVQEEIQLSSEPHLGTWKLFIQASEKSNPVTKTFEIKKYVLPRFEVTIDHESNILNDAEQLEYKICGKYSYGKPVQGEVSVKVNTKVWSRSEEFEYNNLTLERDGCKLLTIPSNEIIKNKILDEIFITASLKEHATDQIENVTVQQKVLRSEFIIDFDTTAYTKLNVPVKLQLLVKHSTNETPAVNQPVDICRRTYYPDYTTTCDAFKTNGNGVVQLIVPPGGERERRYNLEALIAYKPKPKSLKEEPTTTTEATTTNSEYGHFYPSPGYQQLIYNTTQYIHFQSWYSPSNSSIELISNDDELVVQCGSKKRFNVFFNLPSDGEENDETINNLKFTYMIQSRGNIIKSKIITSPQITKIDDFSTIDNILGIPILNTTENDLNSTLYKFDLVIDIDADMSPIANLLIFYVRSDREVVSASTTIKIQKCLKNKVKANWNSEQVYPGEMTTLNIKSSPNAVCSVSAVDKSTSFLSKSSKITKSQVFNDGLNQFKIDENTQPQQKNTLIKCGENEYATYDYDAIQAFESFGVMLMTNLSVETRPCRQYYRPWEDERFVDWADRGDIIISSPASFESHTESLAYPEMSGDIGNNNVDIPLLGAIRTYFPETWLWNLISTNENGHGKLNEKIPDSITEWITTVTCLSDEDGLGIATPTQIRGFKPFFVDYITPYSFKRGEILHLKVGLFNYLNQKLPIKITLYNSDGFELVGDQKSQINACVDSDSNIAEIFMIKATKLGDVNVTVSAEVDKDAKECETNILTDYRDVIVKPIKIEPEGFPIEISKSTYVCPNDYANNTNVRRVWDLTLPENLVADSARAVVSAIGDIMGAALSNLDSLVRLPMGCGEQNMLLMVPNLHVLNYLKSIKSDNEKLKDQALAYMKKGYEREQSYRHKDASFSAFGESDSEGSLWLTSFVVRSFAQSRFHMYVDEEKLQESMDWIISKQLENGCFPTVGLVLHKELLGGLQRGDSNAALTAYVVISLLETGLEIKPAVLEQATYCLAFASNNESEGDTYTMALTAYALSLLDKRKDAKEVLQKLVKNVKYEDGDLAYWTNDDSTALELTIEITSYVILSLLKSNRDDYKLLTYNAIRWLSSHRNEKGGFVSTQDTILALEALAKYATSLQTDKDTNLNITVAAASLSDSIKIDESDKLVLKEVMLPSLPTSVALETSGDGCVLLQNTLKYNVHSVEESDAFGIDIHIDTAHSSCEVQDIKICTWYKFSSDISNMAVLEINMVSGYEPIESSLENLSRQNNPNFKRFENEKKKINLYFSELTNTHTCVSFQVTQTIVIEKRVPAVVKVYDYYHQKLQVSKDYKLEKTCHLPDVPHSEHGEHLPEPMVVVERQERSVSNIEELKSFTSKDY